MSDGTPINVHLDADDILALARGHNVQTTTQTGDDVLLRSPKARDHSDE